MTDKDKIKAQIEKLKSPKGNGDYWDGYDTALDDILSFIDSMSEEPARKVWHGMDEVSRKKADIVYYNPDKNRIESRKGGMGSYLKRYCRQLN